ncbi:MAG: hypothetical protein EHJ95_00610 [Methanobacteriota archaeon]|nr:MAG: hypothetical protein EHJ95_00610 [Euryarchaeota archaeon]
MERNRLIVLGVLSALIVVYGAVTNQLLFMAVGILLVLATAALVFMRRGEPRPDAPGANDAEVSADIRNLKTSVGSVELDQRRIENRLELQEKK